MRPSLMNPTTSIERLKYNVLRFSLDSVDLNVIEAGTAIAYNDSPDASVYRTYLREGLKSAAITAGGIGASTILSGATAATIGANLLRGNNSGALSALGSELAPGSENILSLIPGLNGRAPASAPQGFTPSDNYYGGADTNPVVRVGSSGGAPSFLESVPKEALILSGIAVVTFLIMRKK